MICSSLPSRLLLACGLLVMIGVRAEAAEPTFSKAELNYFENEIRPLLVTHCQKCHGEEKQSGSLRLDHRDALLTGGDTGETIVPGKPDESLLIEAVKWESYEMPPSGKLDGKLIAKLERWIEMGAPWPAEGSPKIAKTEKITEEDRQWWSLQPIVDPEVPTFEAVDLAKLTPKQRENWTGTQVDRFVLRKLLETDLTPATEAERLTLLRRVSFDLTGLPPTKEQIEEYLSDTQPGAWSRLVDRLLDSPHYGERWGRHWLDVVRYAESDGFNQDAYRPTAWRYRDYVVRSFNEDKPYDQFIREQLAGDEIAPTDPEALTATGFLRHGIYEYNQRDAETQWSDILNEVTDVTADVFLGMGMGCAKCHDHKFDPILQKDYFRMRAFFAPLRLREDRPLATPEEIADHERRLAVWEQKTESIRDEIAKIEARYRKNAYEAAVKKFPDPVEDAIRMEPEQRSVYQQQLTELALRQLDNQFKRIPGKLKEDEKKRMAELKKQLEAFKALEPAPLPTTRTAEDIGELAPPTFIPGKERLGEIAPGVPTIFDPEPMNVRSDSSVLSQVLATETTGRRTALANWIADEANPLTARVMVNRIWQYHFGEGLVATSGDFGRLGEPPSHPQLLDWLASRFIESGWSVKEMHRLMLNTAVYRQRAIREMPEVAAMEDPGNRLWWRMRIRRLNAEQIRDAALAATGELDRSTGGVSVAGNTPRRSLYVKVVRNRKDAVLGTFDVPDGLSSTSRRNVTVTPSQALLLFNGTWGLQRANKLAETIVSEAGADPYAQVETAFLRLYGRPPSSEERELLVEFLTGEQPSRLAHQKFAPVPGTKVTGARIDSAAGFEPLRAANPQALPTGSFTLSATVLLESLYPDASVRTIASAWNDNRNTPGWSLGVTSTRSNFKPRNLIMQFVGRNGEGVLTYEVVPSNIHLKLNTPYRVSVVVHQDGSEKPHVEFTVKNLTNADEPIVASVPTKVQTRRLTSSDDTLIAAGASPKKPAAKKPAVPLLIGGREKSTRHTWHGLIGGVELRGLKTPEAKASRYDFASDTPYADLSGNALDLVPATSKKASPQLVDLCHVLLNSNEFLYLD